MARNIWSAARNADVTSSKMQTGMQRDPSQTPELGEKEDFALPISSRRTKRGSP